MATEHDERYLGSVYHTWILAFGVKAGIIRTRSRGETDITAVFGTAIPGSNPGGSTCLLALCGQGESNSRLVLGKDALYHLTMPAVTDILSHSSADIN